MSLAKFMSRDERSFFDESCRQIINHYGDDAQDIWLAILQCGHVK